MRLVADLEIAAWLATRPEVEWDAGNVTKSETKHDFRTADVESIFNSPVLFAGRIVEPEHGGLRCNDDVRRRPRPRG